ncbi:transmembrane and coiled-coil domain-containing protein 4 isoform X6 [Ailuropoda melanoleuca]|uniref:transmembrane and coiled-coil domain-containing protein 4 isoform X6 n=1 Tax=Ailuropoda melanoleuca TaxID=9646 RepID=UPI001494488D|nr:transmembrane and coiled-coil domain-containing protein 4 isoform X6 [Ailuropoda melanoleuca]
MLHVPVPSNLTSRESRYLLNACSIPGPVQRARGIAVNSTTRGLSQEVYILLVYTGLEMATRDRSSQRLPMVAEPAVEGEPHLPTGRELAEANRFAYAALCGVSLSQLFPEPEQSSFCTEFVTGLVKWLELSEAVLPTMTAFANGLGGEGADVFAPILLKDPILKDDPLVIIQDLLSFSLKDGRYDARARVLICHMTSLFRVPLGELDLLEETFLESLKDTKEEESETAEASRKKKENRRKWKRYLLIGLATVGGGTVIGVTGGLAAPLVAASAATIIGSAGAAALGSVAGIAVMTSLFGAAGAGLTGYKMKKRVGAIEEFTFLPLTEGRQLHVTIAVTGWLASGRYRTFSAPWAALARSREQYCLAWEAKYLMELGNALETILSGLANMVAQEALKYTVLSGPETCHLDRLQPGSQGHLLLSARDGSGERAIGCPSLRATRTQERKLHVQGDPCLFGSGHPVLCPCPAAQKALVVPPPPAWRQLRHSLFKTRPQNPILHAPRGRKSPEQLEKKRCFLGHLSGLVR